MAAALGRTEYDATRKQVPVQAVQESQLTVEG